MAAAAARDRREPAEPAGRHRQARIIAHRPGSLAKLTTIISEQGANVIEVSHDRLSLSLNAKDTVLAMMIELADATSGEKMISALAEAGFDGIIGDLR